MNSCLIILWLTAPFGADTLKINLSLIFFFWQGWEKENIFRFKITHNMMGQGQYSLPGIVIEIAPNTKTYRALVLLIALMQCKEYCTGKKLWIWEFKVSLNDNCMSQIYLSIMFWTATTQKKTIHFLNGRIRLTTTSFPVSYRVISLCMGRDTIFITGNVFQ